MLVSIIIPTLNEAENLERLLPHLHLQDERLLEILVIDAKSTDQTVVVAEKWGAKAHLSPKYGRANQMNYGANIAKGDVLYFVHADTLPPKSYLDDIEKAFSEDYEMGCYRFRFDSPRWILKINSFFTRFKFLWCRGGDQSFFIPRPLFFEMGKYKEDYWIMEEYEFIRRAWNEKRRFRIIPKEVLVSARKYDENGYMRVQIANFTVMRMFLKGNASQEEMVTTYKKMLRHR